MGSPFSAMSKLERVRATLAGRPVDRPPFTVWYHFGLQHAVAERTAAAHLEFFQAYDLDWLKVMNDYSYPMPEGVETLSDPHDLARIVPLDPARTPMAEQLRVVEILARELSGRAVFVDTLFDAWNTLRRNVVKGGISRFMHDAPRELEAALSAVNETLIRYARASLARGAAGIFLSVTPSDEYVTREQYERFVRPFDLALLEAIHGQGECHILHAHGAHVYFDRVLDYPVHAISWADRAGGPSLNQARRLTSLTLMAGLRHLDFQYSTAAEVRAEVRDAIHEAGSTKLLLAPGCSLATYTFPELIRAARDEARRGHP
jgi:uroporphyrinogen decarboxylase